VGPGTDEPERDADDPRADQGRGGVTARRGRPRVPRRRDRGRR
jgi:hypothetical protein